MVIMGILGFGQSLCFYLLSKNQVQFDEITPIENSKYPIDYQTLIGACFYVANMMFGNTSWSTYALGKGSQKVLLYMLHFGTAFFIMIHC